MSQWSESIFDEVAGGDDYDENIHAWARFQQEKKRRQEEKRQERRESKGQPVRKTEARAIVGAPAAQPAKLPAGQPAKRPSWAEGLTDEEWRELVQHEDNKRAELLVKAGIIDEAPQERKKKPTGIFRRKANAAKVREISTVDLEWYPAGDLKKLSKKERRTIDRSDPLSLRLIGVNDERGYRYYAGESAFADFIHAELTKKNRGRWFYWHSGGRHDVQFFTSYLFNIGQIDPKFSSEEKESEAPEADPATEKGQDTDVAALIAKLAEGATLRGLATNEKAAATAAPPRMNGPRRKVSDGQPPAPSDLSLGGAFNGSSACIVKVRDQHRHVWCFVDSWYTFQVPLWKIGRALNLPKGDVAFDAPLEELIPYNKRDCEILSVALDLFQKEVLSLGGQLQKTMASTGLDTICRAFLEQDIQTDFHVNDVIERAYKASRVEGFLKTMGHGWHLDINSSFPYSCTFPQPGEYKSITRPSVEEFIRSYLDFGDVGTALDPSAFTDGFDLSFAEAEIEVPEGTHLPPLPWRCEETEQIFFPTGRWTGWFSAVDLKLLVEVCGPKALRKIHTVYNFWPTTFLRKFVLEVYGRRKSAETEFRKTALKLLMNGGAYGKFGETPWKDQFSFKPDADYLERWTIDVDRPGTPEYLRRQKLRPVESIPGLYLQKRRIHVPHRHLPIAAWITSLSRWHLYRHDAEAVKRGGKKALGYSDTDSLFATVSLPTGPELGQLKLEHEILRGEFTGPKLYTYWVKWCWECGDPEDIDPKTKKKAGIPIVKVAPDPCRCGGTVGEKDGRPSACGNCGEKWNGRGMPVEADRCPGWKDKNGKVHFHCTASGKHGKPWNGEWNAKARTWGPMSKRVIKAKGFGKLTDDQFDRLIQGETHTIQHMASLRESWEAGAKLPYEKTIEKRLNPAASIAEGSPLIRKAATIRKRELLPDGSTRPWSIRELKRHFRL